MKLSALSAVILLVMALAGCAAPGSEQDYPNYIGAAAAGRAVF